jgi:hypothetical protein
MRETSGAGNLILYLGANWWGSDARALAMALRQLGNSLIEEQYEDYFPIRWSSTVLRATRRLIRNRCIANYNRAILDHVDNPSINFLLVFKGMMLDPATLAAFSNRGIPIYCFYPDVSLFDHGNNIPRLLACYDCFFTTKRFHLEDRALLTKVRAVELVRHGFDPEVHRRIQLSAAVLSHYGCDVSFVGCWSPKKERLLTVLAEAMPESNLKIWGPGWNRAGCIARRFWEGRGAYGDELAIVYCASRINLGLLSESGPTSAYGDQVTARTWQIPACGGFVLHEKTSELEEYFLPQVEVAIFRDENDLAPQIQHYLGNPEDRIRIAEAGYRRCLTAGYTYVAAAQHICRYHQESCL